MKVELPAGWEKLWKIFDRRFDELKVMIEEGGGISAQDVSHHFRVGLGCSTSMSPAFQAWSAIRHGVTRHCDLRDVLCGKFDDEESDGERERKDLADAAKNSYLDDEA